MDIKYKVIGDKSNEMNIGINEEFSLEEVFKN